MARTAIAPAPTQVQTLDVPEPVTAPCQKCGEELAGDSIDLRLNLTCDDEPLFHCAVCWEREFGERPE